MEQIFDILKKYGLSRQKYAKRVIEMKDDLLECFIDEAISSIAYTDFNRTSVFEFVANVQLSGGAFPCQSLGCRITHATDLSRFAALYADKVLIRHPLELEYTLTVPYDEYDRKKISDGIAIIYQFEPLIRAGIVDFASAGIHFCTDCYAKYAQKAGVSLDMLENIRDFLFNNHANKAKLRFLIENGQPELEIDGLEYISHTSAFRFRETPDFLAKYRDKAISEPVILRKNSRAHKETMDKIIRHLFVDPIMEDVVMQAWYSSLYNTNYVTDRDFDFQVLSLVNDQTTNTFNDSLLQSLSHPLPYIENVELSRIIKLRQEEGESFRVYREAVTNALKQAKGLSQRETKQLLNDVIRPEVANIELTISNSKKILQDTRRRDFLLLSGFVAMALYSGLLPAQIPTEVIGMLGGAKSGLDLLIKTMDSFKEPASIRDNKFYFLWKTSKYSKPSRKTVG